MSNSIKLNNLIDKDLISFSEKPYKSTTHNVEISVWPEFIDSKNSVIGEIYIWAYHIRIHNGNSYPIKLINRYWRIIDETGNIQEVKGDGVVGEQPVIESNSSYQYSSGIHLNNSSGIMTGKYQMKIIDKDEIVEVNIPHFSLDVPNSEITLN